MVVVESYHQTHDQEVRRGVTVQREREKWRLDGHFMQARFPSSPPSSISLAPPYPLAPPFLGGLPFGCPAGGRVGWASGRFH